MDIVFEAMVENMALKKEAFAKMAPIIKPRGDFCLQHLLFEHHRAGRASQRPEKFLGMHFFSPVPAMKLVEIINAYDTSEDTIETGKAVAKGFGKEFVTVTDVPMFIANRVMCPMMNEAAILAGRMSAPMRTSTRPVSWATTCPWAPEAGRRHRHRCDDRGDGVPVPGDR